MHQFIDDMTRGVRPILWMAVVVAAVSISERGTQAHKAVTSKYTFNDHVFPILRDRCGRCHIDGGPAPMSLLTYKDALPWAESIREELVSEKMPPWYVDQTGPAAKGGHFITAREIDTIVTWASGGTPQGDFAKNPAAVVSRPQWRAGTPDLKIDMEAEHTVPAATGEETAQFTLPTTLTETKWVKAVDLLPGAPTMVRDAVISVENGPVLAMWVPGNDSIAAPSGAAFKLSAGAKIHLQIHYKKPWQEEQNAKNDKSAVGLYFTDPPASGREIQALVVGSPANGSESADARRLTSTLNGAARVVAVRPAIDRPYAAVDVHAVTPSGARVSILRLRAARPEWRRRYWLADPVELPSGSRIEVTLTPPLEPDDPRPAKKYPLQIAVDFVPQ